MKRFIAIVIFFLAQFVSNGISCQAEQHDLHEKVAMQFVKLVQKRCYLVHRLEKSIRLLMQFYELKQQQQLSFIHILGRHVPCANRCIIKPGAAQMFHDPVVRHYMSDAEQNQDMRAVHKLWTDFLSYKFIDNDLFVRETIMAILLLYRTLILQQLSPKSHNTFGQQGHVFYRGATVNQMLHTLDDMHEECDVALLSQSRPSTVSHANVLAPHRPSGFASDIYDNFNSILNLLDESYDNADFVINNNMRFYHIQRLLKAIVVLSKLQTTAQKDAWCIDKSIVMHDKIFTHPCIRFCIESMQKAKSPEPLFKLWRHFLSYKFIDDTKFLKEFVTLLFVVYKQLSIQQNFTQKTKDAPSLEELLELYEKISELPIPELINALDAVIDQFINIMEEYEINTSMSWWTWLNKYWWLPPVVIISLLIKLNSTSNDSVSSAAALS